MRHSTSIVTRARRPGPLPARLPPGSLTEFPMIAGLAILLAGCSAPESTAGLSPPSLAQVVVIPSAATLLVGDTLTFKAYGRMSDGDSVGLPVSWSSTAGTITAAGLLTAGPTVGSYTVTALDSSSGRFGTALVRVDTATVPPPPPPSGLANECARPRAGWIWCDDFDQDRLGSYFEYLADQGSFLRASGVGNQGSFGMRAHFNPGQVSAGALHLAFGRTPAPLFRPVDAGTSDYREIYWRVYLRNQSGWMGGGGFKLARATSFVSANWAQAMIAHLWSGGAAPSWDYLVLDPASGTDPSGNVKTTGYNDFPNLRWLGAMRGTTPLFDAGHVGQWYCIETHVRLNDPGQSNGVFEFWINGTRQAGASNLNWVGAYTGYGINAVFLENYWNGGSPAAQDRVFDNFVVSTQRIGC
jgi:hypothetical protein